MQVDVEMYLAASPPLFVSPLMGPLDVSTSRSPFRRQPMMTTTVSNRSRQQAIVTSFNNGINSLDFDFSAMTLSPALMKSAAQSLGRRNFPRPPYQNGGGSGGLPVMTTTTTTPLRSCLVVRSDAEQSPVAAAEEVVESLEPSSVAVSSSSQVEPTSPTKIKKRVIFADSKGLSLTQVKMMTEPSDCPPRWTAEFLEQVTGGASAEVAADRWEMTFAQPASDYLDFRARLDKQNLSLENVLFQEADQLLVGTVKVKNLSFSKQVTVRVTFDNWMSQTDVDATFAPSGLQGASVAAINLFDTFSFKIPIPAVVPSNRIQFCVRFTSEAGEFWDNNMGKNYVIIKPIIESMKIGTNRINGGKDAGSLNGMSNSSRLSAKYSDLLSPGSKVDYWTDFASWNHLVNDSPYW